MPTVIKRDRSGSLFASLVDLFRITDKLEENPGINIGHITVYHNNYVIVLSGFRGYKVLSEITKLDALFSFFLLEKHKHITCH